MASNGGRTGKAYDAWRALVIARETDCYLCGKPVDKRLSGRHKWGPTADHVTPIARGGAPLDPANGRLAHKFCNMVKGVDEPEVEPERFSRVWTKGHSEDGNET